MATLYQVKKQNISYHLTNIFKEGELTEDSVVKEFLITGRAITGICELPLFKVRQVNMEKSITALSNTHYLFHLSPFC